MAELDSSILLENGRTFSGRWVTAVDQPAIGEAVFNTSMMGYQEILTDPSYAGQIVVMTYPLIGNYGVNRGDLESQQVHCRAFIVKELSEIHSNFASEGSLKDFLEERKIPCMEGVDTRALTRALRDKGAMKCTFLKPGESVESGMERLKTFDYGAIDFASEVSHKDSVLVDQDVAGENLPKVAVLDFGIKANILRLLSQFCEPTVFHLSQMGELEKRWQDFDGYFLSNGPGDPEAVQGVRELIQRLAHSGKPLFGICLGHQLLSLAMGCQTYKLKFGHHGGNHPIRNEKTTQVEITSQNHGYAVEAKTLPQGVKGTHTNLNDGSLAGIELEGYPVYSIQYHPESNPGPHDARYLFERFARDLKSVAAVSSQA